MSDYKDYRRDNPGPLSNRSFEFWKENGGEDLPTFKWKSKDKNVKKKQNNNHKNHHKNQQKQKKTYKIYKNEIKNMNGGIVHYH